MYEPELLYSEKINLFAVGIIFMFKYVNTYLPIVLDSMFSYRHEIHVRNTRGANHLHLEQFLTNICLKGMRYYRYYSAKSLNDVFINSTNVNSSHVFNVRFKVMLLANNLLEENITSSI